MALYNVICTVSFTKYKKRNATYSLSTRRYEYATIPQSNLDYFNIFFR